MPNVSRLSVAYLCLDELLQQKKPDSIASRLIQTDDAAYCAWNLAAVCPWMTVDDPPAPRRKANALPPVGVVAREGFKAPNKLNDIITASYRHRREILELKNAVCNNESYINERDRFGMAIRKWDAQGGSWRLQVLSALLVEAMETLEAWPKNDAEGADVEDVGKSKFLSGWQIFLDHLAKLDVYDAPVLKRVLDGRQLAQALGTKPGKWTGKALELCVAWQLRNPDEKDPAGAIAVVREHLEDLGIGGLK